MQTGCCTIDKTSSNSRRIVFGISRQCLGDTHVIGSTVPTGFGADVTMDMSEWIVVAGGGKKKIMMDGIEKEED